LKREGDKQVTGERWQLAKGIVADALEEQSPTRRAELVANRCGDDLLLRREVESLLEQTTHVFDECAENALDLAGASAPTPLHTK
jgi:hypothetical protein